MIGFEARREALHVFGTRLLLRQLGEFDFGVTAGGDLLRKLEIGACGRSMGFMRRRARVGRTAARTPTPRGFASCAITAVAAENTIAVINGTYRFMSFPPVGLKLQGQDHLRISHALRFVLSTAEKLM